MTFSRVEIPLTLRVIPPLGIPPRAPTYQFHCQEKLIDKISCIFFTFIVFKKLLEKQHYKKDENRNILAIQGKETEIQNKTVLAVMAGSREDFEQSGYNTEKLYNYK